MSELRELYQQVILDHNKKPRNFRKIDRADHCAAGHNPLCGDKLTVYLKLEDGVVAERSAELDREFASGAGAAAWEERGKKIRAAAVATPRLMRVMWFFGLDVFGRRP